MSDTLHAVAATAASSAVLPANIEAVENHTSNDASDLSAVAADLQDKCKLKDSTSNGVGNVSASASGPACGLAASQARALIPPLSERDGEVFTLDFSRYPHYYFPRASSPVHLEAGKHAPKCTRAEIAGLEIPGSFVIHNVLTKRECVDIVNALKGINAFQATCIQGLKKQVNRLFVRIDFCKSVLSLVVFVCKYNI